MLAELTLSTIEPVLRVLDLAGMAVFAVSGALVAARKRLDIIAAGFALRGAAIRWGLALPRHAG